MLLLVPQLTAAAFQIQICVCNKDSSNGCIRSSVVLELQFVFILLFFNTVTQLHSTQSPFTGNAFMKTALSEVKALWEK
jgi:hypothetical protein